MRAPAGACRTSLRWPPAGRRQRGGPSSPAERGAGAPGRPWASGRPGAAVPVGSRSCGARPPGPSCRGGATAPLCSRAVLRMIRSVPVTGPTGAADGNQGRSAARGPDEFPADSPPGGGRARRARTAGRCGPPRCRSRPRAAAGPVRGPGRRPERRACAMEMLGISSGGTSPATGRELKIVRSHDVIAFPGHFSRSPTSGIRIPVLRTGGTPLGAGVPDLVSVPARSGHAPPAVSVHPAPAEGGAAHAYHRQNKTSPP